MVFILANTSELIHHMPSPHKTASVCRQMLQNTHFWNLKGLLPLSAAIALGLAMGEPARADVESECQAVIQEVSDSLVNRHGVGLASVSSGSVEDSGYDIPLSPTGEPFPRSYRFSLANSTDAEASRSESFLGSPSLMGSYAQAISDRCRPASLVIFGLDRTGFGILYGLNEEGEMQPFECVEVEPDLRPETLEWGYDYNCNL